MEIPSDGLSSPASSCSSDAEGQWFKMNWDRMEFLLPPLDKFGEEILDEGRQRSLFGYSLADLVQSTSEIEIATAPGSSCSLDAEEQLFKRNWYRMESGLPPLNQLGEEYTPDEEIDRKQAELVAAQIALEKLRQHDRLLTTKNDMLVEENNLLKAQNEELCSKLLRSEGILSRIKEELTRFRAANGRAANGINPCIHGGGGGGGEAGGGQCSTSFLLNSLSEFFVVASPLQLVGRQVYVEERRPSSNSSSTMSCGGGSRLCKKMMYVGVLVDGLMVEATVAVVHIDINSHRKLATVVTTAASVQAKTMISLLLDNFF